MAYSDVSSLAVDATFLGRLRAALTKKALSQLAAANDGSPRFEKRSRLAIRILTEPDTVIPAGGSQTSSTVRVPAVVQQLAWAVCTNNPSWTVASPPNDSTLDSGISVALVDAFAGVFSTD